jgi:hypothetical protein
VKGQDARVARHDAACGGSDGGCATCDPSRAHGAITAAAGRIMDLQWMTDD